MELKGKKRYLLPLVLFMFFIQFEYVNGETSEKNPRVLVTYSSSSGEIDEYQRMLDMLIGHFTENIMFKKPTELKQEDLNQTDYLFYYGQERELLTEQFVHLVERFNGIFVAIGHNVDQLGDSFSFFEQTSNEGVIHQIHIPNQINKTLSFEPQFIIPIQVVDQDTKILVIGENNHQKYPLFVKNNNKYYFASNNIMPPFSILLAEIFHEVFPSSGEEHLKQVGYIRLEDIHPLVDPDKLMDIAKLLKEKELPYLIAVIPVYINPETKRRYHFSDSPKLVKTLKYMQDNGGSIVLHGYTHQFRSSETGEGFEFWDVENNRPIYHGPDEKVEVKSLEDFDSEASYLNDLKAKKAFEKQYIENRLTKGIQELSNYGLYPLAFEAPHYTMSQHGYEVTSNFFSTYVGQLQLSDADWTIMRTIPYITKPSFLKGMTLLPETIGYINPDKGMTIEQMMLKAENYLFVRDGMIGAFYHPYLGVELFEQLLEELEKFEHVHWIDLKKMDAQVRAELVAIETVEGEIHTNVNHIELFQTSKQFLHYHIIQFITAVLWGMAGIGTLGVILFILFLVINIIFHNRKNRGETIG